LQRRRPRRPAPGPPGPPREEDDRRHRGLEGRALRAHRPGVGVPPVRMFALAAGALAALAASAALPAPAAPLAPSPLPSPAPGLVDVGGHRLDVLRAGSGSPPVVFEAGLGNALEAWERVWPAVAGTNEVVVYSRSGLGRSERGPLPHTARGAVEELH